MDISYNRLFDLLKEKNIKKTEFAKEVGISLNTLAKFSKNEHVSMDIIVKICQQYNCSVDQILEVLPKEN